MHKSQKDSMVQQQTADIPSDIAQQPGIQGQLSEGAHSPAPAPAFDAAAYAAAAAVRTSSPGECTDYTHCCFLIYCLGVYLCMSHWRMVCAICKLLEVISFSCVLKVIGWSL